MKFYAAALLAIGAAAIHLADEPAGENADGHPVDADGNRALPHEAPVCGPEPENVKNGEVFASGANLAAAVDAANAESVSDGTITEREAFNALYCLVVWDKMPEEDAWAAFDGFQADHGAGGSVSVEVAAKELQEALDGSDSDSGSGSDCECECDDDNLCQM